MSRNLTVTNGLTRREFTVESILALLAGVAITVSGCGSNSSPSAPTTTTPTTGTSDVAGVVSDNHGHTAVVTSAEITAANAVSLNIQGSATHNHVVSLTADQIRSIGARTRVAVQSTTDVGHLHTVTFN